MFENTGERRHETNTIPKSTYNSRTITLTLDFATDDDATVEKCSTVRIMEQIVAADRF